MASRGDENDEQSVIDNTCDSLKYFKFDKVFLTEDGRV